jgi:hypothetical protein
MDIIEKLFKETNDTSFHKFENQDFEDVGKVHDWRNYAPEEIVNVWDKLTDREKKLIFIMCETMADREEWD